MAFDLAIEDGDVITNLEGMKTEDAVARLLSAVPRSETWAGAAGEAHGPGNIVPEAIVKRVLYCVTVTPAVEEFFTMGRYDLLVAHHPYRPRGPIPHVILHTAEVKFGVIPDGCLLKYATPWLIGAEFLKSGPISFDIARNRLHLFSRVEESPSDISANTNEADRREACQTAQSPDWEEQDGPAKIQLAKPEKEDI